MRLFDVLSPEDLFHPQMFYEGEWLLGGEFSLSASKTDYLLLNAKTVKGKNAYLEFLENHYIRPLAGRINSEAVVRPFFPKISLGVDEKKEKRRVTFSLTFFLYEQLSGLLDEEGAMARFSARVATDSEPSAWVEQIKKELRVDRAKYQDVLNRGEKSDYYSLILQMYLDYMRYAKTTLPMQRFLEGRISSATKLIVGARYYPEFFEKEIDTRALLEAFDYDTFCLLAARSALDGCRVTESRENMVDNAIGYVRHYLDAVKEIRKTNPKYDCRMVILDSDTGRRKTINIADIERETEALLARHPEFSFIKTDDREIATLLRTQGLTEEEILNFDVSTKKNQELLASLLKKLRANQELAAQWRFIPKGTGLQETSSERVFHGISASLEEDEKIRRMLISKEFLENSPYIYKLYGIDKFEGYIGYMYLNGAVVFNKYYQNIKTKKVAYDTATYVMRFSNFMELSKLSKTEIIHRMKHDRTAQIERIYHREDMDRWISEVQRAISGDDYKKEVQDFIELMIASNKLQRPEVKS